MCLRWRGGQTQLCWIWGALGLLRRGLRAVGGGPYEGKSLEVGQGWRAGRGRRREGRARPQKGRGRGRAGRGSEPRACVCSWVPIAP